MAESVNRTNQKSYLRQIQQEQAEKKRQIMDEQKNDMRALREHYAELNKDVDADSAAAINHIRKESNDASREEAAQRLEAQNQEKAEKEQAAQEMRDQRSTSRSPASKAAENDSADAASTDKQQIYNRKAQKATLQQNYETKESDDFYRVQNRGSRVSENQNGYVIEAYAPAHEKDNLRVSVHRNRAVVSGQRKFGDEATEGNKTMSTHNFQTFREEFKFDRPVSHEGMTRERVGDFVRFTIPKIEGMAQPEVDET